MTAYSGWQPIETAPRNINVFEDILVYDSESECYEIVCWGQYMTTKPQDGWINTHDRIIPCAFEPTHWMPLPLPPK